MFTFKFQIKNFIMLNIKNIKITKSNNSLNYKNLNLFQIKKVIDNIIYKLDLFESMLNIFLVFHF